MDYKEKYDGALERAREWYNDPHITIGLKGNLEDIFPELKESEDERIRKELISFLQLPHPQFVGERKQERWLAWLEKQAPVEHFELKRGHWYMCHRAYCCRADYLTVQEGERFECKEDGVVKGFVIKDPEKYFIEVHAPAPMEDDQNDEVRRRSTIQVLEYAKSLDAYNQYGKADIDKNITWLEKQGEQKLDSYCQEHCKGYQETGKCYVDGECEAKKNAETAWSEEDVAMLDSAIAFVEHSAFTTIGKGKGGVVAWLKSLKDRVLLQQKQEWSEEDENRFNNLIFLVEHSDENKATKEGFIKFINKLKSLRPQSTWKPSDEQMYILNWVANILMNKDGLVENNAAETLNSLYNNLKKLKG